jgi:hypothetical protein
LNRYLGTQYRPTTTTTTTTTNNNNNNNNNNNKTGLYRINFIEALSIGVFFRFTL